jgi:hypothetical protein
MQTEGSVAEQCCRRPLIYLTVRKAEVGDAFPCLDGTAEAQRLQASSWEVAESE